MISYPLTRANRIRLARAYRDAPRVDLSIACVLEDQMGRAFANDLHDPTVFRIEGGPFIYYAGDPSGPAAREALASMSPDQLLMPSAPGWLEAARQVHGERLVPFDRYRFSSERLSADHLDQLAQAAPTGMSIRRMDVMIAHQVWGQENYSELSEFDSAGDFAERGIGYYASMGDGIAGAAYSSLVCSQGIEISIFIEPEQRRKGIAIALAARLIRWCLEQGFEPHWDAANPESCKLAMKLGYSPAGSYEAHYLSG